MATTPTLYLTTLPNGLTADGRRLQLTVLLTPSLAEGGSLGPFADWPGTVAQQSWNENWVVTFNPIGATPALTVVSSTPCSTIWQAVFDGVSNVKARRDANSYKSAWIVSHRAHEIHGDIRAERGRRHLLRRAGGQDPDLERQIKRLNEMNTVAREQKNLYLHPWVPGRSTDGTPQDFLDQMDAAARATKFFTDGTIFSGAATGVDLVTVRIKHGLSRLQADPGVRLRASALLALYRHCAQSIGPGQILTNVSNEIANYPSAISTAVPAVQRYVEFHLFHRRSKAEHDAMVAHDLGCGQPDTDFHDALSRLNQFPALLRPLGLAFDLEVAFPDLSKTWVTVTASNRVSLDPISIVPLTTNCSLVQPASGQPFTDFFATPQGSDLITNRYLFLQATGPDESGAVSPLFEFVSEDTDGSAHKTLLQSQAESRKAEYGSAASDGSADDTMPSARTVGVSLLYTNRKQRTQDAITRNTTIGDPRVPLFAEDLVLGYRVDVQRNGNWLSLNARASSYDIVNAKHQKQLTWLARSGPGTGCGRGLYFAHGYIGAGN